MKIIINKPTEFEAIYLKVDAGVRYWDDAKVNGEYDTNCEDFCMARIGVGDRLLKSKQVR